MTANACADLEVSTRDAICCLSLNRPQSKNGLTLELCAAIIAALAEAAKDPAIRAVMLTGKGGAFCSGLDLKAAVAMVQALQDSDKQGGSNEVGAKHLREYFHGVIRGLRAVAKPVVAFLDGDAVGFGCDLALACDLRIGTARATFSELFVKRGLMPDGGGTYSLSRIIGVGKALEMMFLGDTVAAEEAVRLGLLNRVVPDAEAAWALMGRLAAGPPLALRAIKEAVYGAQGGSLDDALEVELRSQIKLLSTSDCAEGMSAFFMKRPPAFTGT
jgi:enoyl-CoA hydratase/carnithine racemase